MFLSSFENKIDKKGRVSVPATFRSHLSSMGYNGFISYPSFNHSALEACSQDRIEKLSNTIDSLNPFEEKRDFFATSILSESENLQFDTEGRVSFSEKLLKHAKIKTNILFVGLGKTFQIWEPNNFDESEILPSLSNCKFTLSDKIDVAKKSLFSSKGFKESIVLEIFSILSCGHASID